MGYPTVYPMGTTVYKPDKCFNGLTVYSSGLTGGVLIDMNGAEMNVWKGIMGFPVKLFPGGHIFGSRGERNPLYGFQDQIDLVQWDWNGNVVWEFNKCEYIEDPGEKPGWQARQHHDFQRTGNPVGYYVPGMDPLVNSGNTLILSHRNLHQPKISDELLIDDIFIEVDWEGNIVWEWVCSDHFDDMGFDDVAKEVLRRNPNVRKGGSPMGDWMHINCMSTLGPNKHYDAGDERFHPDNIIWDGRETNILAIISKETGKIVWRVGPDYSLTPELRKLGWIIGPHHTHMIPKGLPGEGNILCYDNGGWAGYGAPNPASFDGTKNAWRDYTRIIEFNPVTLEMEWQHTPTEAGFQIPYNSSRFYSPFVSAAQRLPNGNTMITEGSEGRLLEVTPYHELVWEYHHPYRSFGSMHMIYRAYRVPYEWAPQAQPTPEVEIPAIDNKTWRVPGARSERFHEVDVPDCLPYVEGDISRALCIGSSEDE